MQIRRLWFWIVFSLSAGPVEGAVTPETLAARLDSLPQAVYALEYRVTQPMTDEEVLYRVDVQYRRVPADTLAGYDYLCDVRYEGGSSGAPDFFAYFDGSFYAFRSNRLREYHAAEYPQSFASRRSGGREIPGVHRSTLFSQEFPLEMARWLRALACDTASRIEFRPDTLLDGVRQHLLTVRTFSRGEEVQRIRLRFDAVTGFPCSKEVENSPGSFAEHRVSVRYRLPDPAGAISARVFTPSGIRENKSYAFTDYRESGYALNTLRGKAAPLFSLPQLGGKDRFDLSVADTRPCVLLFADTRSSFCDTLLVALQPLWENPRFSRSVRWVLLFREKEPESIEKFVRSHEFPGAVLYNGASVVRDYGVTGYPTWAVVDADRTVVLVQAGYDAACRTLLAQQLEELVTP